jgi:hypothetical protein
VPTSHLQCGTIGVNPENDVLITNAACNVGFGNSSYSQKALGSCLVVRQLFVKGGYSFAQRGALAEPLPKARPGYLSMRNGSVTSEVLDLVNAGRLAGEGDRPWEECIGARTNHEVKLEQQPAREHLSDAEVLLLDEVWAEHGGKDQWQLVDWCHVHCREWVPVANGCAPISVEQVGMALGKNAEQVARLRQEAAELNQLDEIFSAA